MPQSTPAMPVPRRAASLPIPGRSGADPQIEELFTLPWARIISFQTSGSISRRASSSNDTSLLDGEVGTVEWRSRFETIVGVGMLFPFRSVVLHASTHCYGSGGMDLGLSLVTRWWKYSVESSRPSQEQVSVVVCGAV